MTRSDPDRIAAHRRQRVIGALVGSVVGDALGAPFEFGEPGKFSREFPQPARGLATEMCGGRGWKPGEWTDDTQMGLIVAASLLDRDDLDESDLYDRFVNWLNAGPQDVGIQTRSVLGSSFPWNEAAAHHFNGGNRAAGNGSIMRATPGAIFFARSDVDDSVAAARQISDLTHGDPAAGDACAIFHRLIAVALGGGDVLAAVPDALAEIPTTRRTKWAEVLADGWTPAQATESNGAVWPTLGTAVWAMREGWAFEEAMRHVIDLGGDTDTIACVAGGLLGAVQGIQAIPSRWTTPLNGTLPGQDPIARNLTDLIDVALQLDGEHTTANEPDVGAAIEPVEVMPGIWLSNLWGAPSAPHDAVMISLCRTWDIIEHVERRQVYLLDNADNLDVDTPLVDVLDTIEAAHADGRPVLVHCWGGQSRTGLVLRAWLRHTQGLSSNDATDEAIRLWPNTGLWNETFDDALARLSSATQ